VEKTNFSAKIWHFWDCSCLLLKECLIEFFKHLNSLKTCETIVL
jgi:hypothetical protein